MQSWKAWSFITAFGVPAIYCVFIFLFGRFDETEMKILFTSFAMGFGVLLGHCGALQLKEKYMLIGILDILFSVIVFCFTLVIIWDDWYDENFLRYYFISIICAFSLAHASLMLLIKPVDGLVRNFLCFTITSMVILSFMLVVICLNSDLEFLGEFYFRFLGIMAVLTSAGSILTPILYKIRK